MTKHPVFHAAPPPACVATNTTHSRHGRREPRGPGKAAAHMTVRKEQSNATSKKAPKDDTWKPHNSLP